MPDETRRQAGGDRGRSGPRTQGKRWIPRVLGAASLFVAALAPTMAPAEEGGRPAVWAGQAVARGVSLAVNTEPRVLPLDDLVRIDAPEGASSWTGTSADARASVAYPGSSGTGGPRMLCEFGFPCPDGFPPSYPFTAHAQWPAQPDARTPAGVARARAGPEDVSTVAELTGAGPAVLDPLAPAIEVGAATAVTGQGFDGDALVVTARARVADVKLLGGLVTIDAVESAARSWSRAGQPGRSDASLRLAGVVVAGHRATIDAGGIDVAPGPGHEEAQHALEQALERWNARIRLVGDSESAGSTTTARATGLLIDVTVPVAGPPAPLAGSAYRSYVANIVVGDAASSAYAAGAAGPVAVSAADAEPAPGSEVSVHEPPPASAAHPQPTTTGEWPGIGTNPSPGRVLGTERRPPLLRLLGGLVAERVALAYAAAALLGVGALGVSRLLVREPSGR